MPRYEAINLADTLPTTSGIVLTMEANLSAANPLTLSSLISRPQSWSSARSRSYRANSSDSATSASNFCFDVFITTVSVQASLWKNDGTCI